MNKEIIIYKMNDEDKIENNIVIKYVNERRNNLLSALIIC